MIPPLTDYERALVQDAELMLAKNNIIEKVVHLFNFVYQSYQPIVHEYLPVPLQEINGKISKGEKYEGLPYVVLDYPRLFTRQNIFAIRSLFWWGNDFGITLHLQGTYQQLYAQNLQQSINRNELKDWFIQVDGDAWQHAVQYPFQLIEPGKDYELATVPFIKIAKKIPLQEWDQIDIKLLEYFKLLVSII